MRGFLGNWMGVIRAYAWIRSMGPEGLKEVAEISVLNNNYLDNLLMAIKGVSRPYAEGHRRLDQVRYSLEQLKEDTGVGTEALRDRMVDFGIQSMWMSHHPWVVPEPFTPEPCETYSKDDLDEWAAVIKKGSDEAYADPQFVLDAPHAQPIDQLRAHRGHGGPRAVGLHLAQVQEEVPEADVDRRAGRRRGRRPAPDEGTSHMRQDLTVGQRVLRSMGLTILLMTALVCGSLAYTYATGDQFGGWRQPLVVLSLLLAAVAALTMTIDSFDLWMRGRRITAFSVRMVHSLVFVALLVAVVLSVVSGTPGLLLVMTPALVIYLFTVMRPQPASRPGPARAGRSSRRGRQKRGGKKRS